ncbi:MAG TPA: phosphatidylserine decarboxylase, partial [Thermoanaerobaculia bacterium]|nr:phosphatidylserine decarboxylase [Thermoanaerobaculia bacterium]
NEQNRITLETRRSPVIFKQIAGVLARRIVFYPRRGDRLERGSRIGIILFGSRVDLFVPDGTEILVGRGDKVKAGKTGIARWM